MIELAGELLDYPPELGSELAWQYRESNPLKAAKFLISGALHSQYISTHILDGIRSAFVEKNGEINPSALEDTREVIKAYLAQVELSDKSQIIESLLPIYQHLIRALLFGVDDYSLVRELSLKFIQASNEEDGLFDFAYSSYHLDRVSDAEEAYKKLIDRETENDAAINNLAVIYENQGKLDDAFSLYKKAAEIRPEEKLYSSNSNRITTRFEKRSKSQAKIKSEFDKRKAVATELGISEDILDISNHS
ncbi:MAG TPA: tetratricopeptide repeat protein [Anaerolineales bacterium]|nr:tetratricopeptide repeat protein [Anaerolineales bacterium]